MFPVKPLRYSAHLDVHYARLEHNICELRRMRPEVSIIFMVKADAYGHGLLDIVNFCVNHMNVKHFGVATLGEALFLRSNLLGEYEIFVFSETHLENRNLAENYGLQRIIPVLSGLRQIDAFLSSRECQFVPMVIKLNTGMNRLGLTEEDVGELCQKLKKRGRTSIQHLMTHFSSDQDSLDAVSFSKQQVRAYQEIQAQIESHGVKIEHQSLSNSAAITHQLHEQLKIKEDFMRPGIMLYGPSAGVWGGKVISDLSVEVLHKFHAKKGTTIGYGPEIVAEDCTLVVLAIGYGDGLNRHLKNLSIETSWGSGKIIGRMNMDMTYLSLPVDCQISVGDHVLLWGEKQEGIKKMADHLSTIPYEIFCHLGVRLPKRYWK